MTPMEQMIAMTRGPQRGRALVEDSPLEAPVGGLNRHTSLMSPATREMVLKSRTQEIEKFAESRQLNANAVLGIAEAAMRLGRVPDLRQYGFSGDDAKAIKHFIAGDVLNIAIEHIEGMETINEALTDRMLAVSVKQLVQSGAATLLRKVKEDKDKPGYLKALGALKTGDLAAVKSLMGEGATTRGASLAVVHAMDHADAKVKEQVKTEATVSNNLGALMSISQNQTMYRPSPVLTTAVRKDPDEDRQEQERAMALGPRIGINPFAKQAVTIEDMAKLANEADGNVQEGSQSWKKLAAKAKSEVKAGGRPGAGTMARMDRKQSRAGYRPKTKTEAADDVQNPTAASPQGEKVKSKKDKKLRSAGEYEPGQFHPGSHGTAEAEEGVKTEAEKWIAKAIKKKGALHKQMGVPEGKKIPAKKLTAAAKKGGKLGQRARLAQTLKKLNK